MFTNWTRARLGAPSNMGCFFPMFWPTRGVFVGWCFVTSERCSLQGHRKEKPWKTQVTFGDIRYWEWCLKESGIKMTIYIYTYKLYKWYKMWYRIAWYSYGFLAPWSPRLAWSELQEVPTMLVLSPWLYPMLPMLPPIFHAIFHDSAGFLTPSRWLSPFFHRIFCKFFPCFSSFSISMAISGT